MLARLESLQLAKILSHSSSKANPEEQVKTKGRMYQGLLPTQDTSGSTGQFHSHTLLVTHNSWHVDRTDPAFNTVLPAAYGTLLSKCEC